MVKEEWLEGKGPLGKPAWLPIPYLPPTTSTSEEKEQEEWWERRQQVVPYLQGSFASPKFPVLSPHPPLSESSEIPISWVSSQPAGWLDDWHPRDQQIIEVSQSVSPPNSFSFLGKLVHADNGFQNTTTSSTLSGVLGKGPNTWYWIGTRLLVARVP